MTDICSNTDIVLELFPVLAQAFTALYQSAYIYCVAIQETQQQEYILQHCIYYSSVYDACS